MHRYYDYTGFFIRFLTSANGAIGAGTSAITCTMFGGFFFGGGGRERERGDFGRIIKLLADFSVFNFKIL